MDRRVAIVTGGTGGLGTAICQKLSAEYQVIACYFKKGQHEQASLWKEEQRTLGFEIDIRYGDVSRYAECERLVSQVIEQFGHIDVLVNNAGITRDSRLVNMDLENWQQVIDANLTSVFNMTRNVIPFMIDKRYGRIVSISSVNGRKGQFGQCNYAASKAALFGFTKSLALEVAKKGITVNTISPGYIKTSMLASMKPEIIDAIIANIPVGRLGDPREIASAVAYLIAPESAFITGANMDINGGQYM